MKYYRILEEFGDKHLCVQNNEKEIVSLTSINDLVLDYKSLLETSNITGLKVDEITKDLLKSKQGRRFDLNKLLKAGNLKFKL